MLACCSRVRRVLAMLWLSLAETMQNSICAPAAIARSAPLRLGASAPTRQPVWLCASRREDLRGIGELGKACGGIEAAASTSGSPQSARRASQRSLSGVVITRRTSWARPGARPHKFARRALPLNAQVM